MKKAMKKCHRRAQTLWDEIKLADDEGNFAPRADEIVAESSSNSESACSDNDDNDEEMDTAQMVLFVEL